MISGFALYLIVKIEKDFVGVLGVILGCVCSLRALYVVRALGLSVQCGVREAWE